MSLPTNYPLEAFGVEDYPVKVGSMLLTLVDPHKGFEAAYNRWYERDHYIAGCLIGPYNFAGSRWVATRELKDLRWGTAPPGSASASAPASATPAFTLATPVPATSPASEVPPAAPPVSRQALAALRKELNGLVGAWSHRTGQPHGVIHNELRRTCGGPPLPQATADQIRDRIDTIRRWAISGR